MNKSRMKVMMLLWAALLCCGAEAVPVAGHAEGPLLESSLSYRRFTTLDGLSQMQTETVWQDAHGYIYIGTLSGFVRYDGRSLTPFLGGRRENIVAFQEVEGQVRALGFVRQWLVSGNEASMTPIDPKNELLLNNFNATDLPPGYVLLEDRKEQNRVLCQMGPQGMERFMKLPVLDEMTPDRKLYLDSKSLYVPTAQGLFRLDSGGTSVRLTTKGDYFSLIRTDGQLLALAADGIYTVNGDSMMLRHAFHFEAPDYGLSVRQDRQGRLFIADSHTIWRYDDTSQTMQQLATGFNLIKGLYVDSWNRLWAATYQGAYCFFHCDFVNHRLADPNDIVRSVAMTDSTAVMGTLNGKVLVNGREVYHDDENYFAPSAAVLADGVYMVGRGDMAVVRGDSVHWLGLSSDKYQFVSRFGDRLIIGTRSSLLSYEPASRHIDTLTTEIVRPWCAADDGQGRLWVGGNSGVYCLTGIEQGPLTVKQVKATPTALVATTMSSNRRGQMCFAVGDSLFATQDGQLRPLTELQPALKGHEVRSVHLSPHGYVVAAAIDGLLVARLDDVGRVVDQHWFDAANGFTMIEPLAATMAETADGTVWLAGLEQMTSFRPDALLADNREEAVVRLPVPWWQRWWVWIALAVVLALAVWGVARWHERRVARRKLQQLQREKMQKELQLSAVRLKSIPHFHSNVLASIEYFVMNHSTDEAIHYLKLYSDFTNQTLADIDRPSRPVADEVDYVRSYLELERLRYGERLNYSISVAPDVDQNTQLPTMLLHTYCQNAVKHGIANKAGEGNVSIGISRQQRDGANGVLVSVSDDGVGRLEAAHAEAHSSKQGLKILQQQIELYNRANRHHIVQQVTDLTDDNGRPAGTRFETWVPVDFVF